MSLPNVIFKYRNGELGGNNPTADTVAGLIIQVPEAPEKFPLGAIKTFYTLDDVETAGLTADFDEENACSAYGELREFFSKTGGKGEIWVMLVSNTTSMADICDLNNTIAKKLLLQSDGRICFWGIACNRGADYQPEIKDGLDSDVWAGVTNAQVLRDTMALSYFIPTRVVIPGRAFNGSFADLADLTTMTNNGVQISLHGRKGSPEAKIGFVLGLLASLPVQRSEGRVRNGDLKIQEAYLTDGVTRAEELNAVQDVLHDKGYLFPIVRFRRSGYFYNGAPMATSKRDDFRTMTNGRVIDKVQRIAYDVYVDYLNDDFMLSRDGKIGAAELKNLQGDIDEAIRAVMVSNNELSGFECYVDPTQDPMSAGKTEVVLRPQPRGYHEAIEVSLGFTKALTE